MSTVPERVNNPFGRADVVAAPGAGASAAAVATREAQDVMMQMMCARQFPRDVIRATDRIINAFTRVELCEEGMYAYSRGGSDVSGLSIRAAEVLAQNWGNLRTGVEELTRLGDRSEFRVYAQDLETGFTDEKRFFVRHWRDTKKGGYQVTDERDIYEIGANYGARRKRACILTVIPKDVQDAAERQIEVTLKNKAEVTPDAIKLLLEAFGKFSVTKEQIEKRIQRHIEAMLPAQLVQMRRIFASLKDGMSTPEEWFDPIASGEQQPRQGDQGTGTAQASAVSGSQAVKERLRERKGGEPAKSEGQKDLGGNIPQFDGATAIAELKKAATSADLEKSWGVILKDFETTNRLLPEDLEPFYHDRKEALKEQEAKQSDL
jgi:hypothetical protein